MYENLVLPSAAPIVLWWQRPDLVASWIAAGAAIAGLLLIVYQVKLQREQTRQTKRQTELIEKQDEILARRACLELRARIRPKSLDMEVQTGWVRVEFRLENTGKSGARDYYWHLYFPRVWPYEWEGGVIEPIHKDRIYRRGGSWFKYFAGYVDRPLHPNRAAVIGSMKVPSGRFPFIVEWQATCDDGAFPGENPGPIEVKLIIDEKEDSLQKDEQS